MGPAHDRPPPRTYDCNTRTIKVVWYFTTSQLRSTFMPLCFGAGGRPGALLQGPPGEFSRATRVFSITKLAYAKKLIRSKGRRSVVFQRNYIRKPLPAAPSPHLIFRAPSGFTSLFCSVGLYAHCHWWCPPCLIRRYRVVLVYSRINSKAKNSGHGECCADVVE